MCIRGADPCCCFALWFWVKGGEGCWHGLPHGGFVLHGRQVEVEVLDVVAVVAMSVCKGGGVPLSPMSSGSG